MTRARLRFLLSWLGVLTFIACGCSRKGTRALIPAAVEPVENAYIDLRPGWTLQVVVPLLKTGAPRSKLIAQSAGHDSISFSTADLSGYTSSQYAVTGKQSAGVRLKPLSSQNVIDGKAAPAKMPPDLPFVLPGKTEHVRLIYLVRSSQADHNMAIAGSKRVETLNLFTDRLRKNQEVCESRNGIFCSWVPVGVAVRWNDR